MVGIGSVGLDVTQQRAFEAKLRQAQKLQAVGQLTGGVAHDFNNLLQVIETNLSLAKMGLAAGSNAEELIDAALRAERRGAVLTQKLLAYSRPAGRCGRSGLT